MNRQDFILNTLKPYFLDKSLMSIKDGVSLYRHPNGNKCALGKHIRDDAYVVEMDKPSESHTGLKDTSAMTILHHFPDCLTKEAAAQNLTPEQWYSIQNVHDNIDCLDYIERCEEDCGVSLSELKDLIKRV